MGLRAARPRCIAWVLARIASETCRNVSCFVREWCRRASATCDRQRTHCAYVQDAQETNTHLALPLDDCQTLRDCLTKFTAEERLDGARRPNMRQTPSNGPTYSMQTSCCFGADGAHCRSILACMASKSSHAHRRGTGREIALCVGHISARPCWRQIGVYKLKVRTNTKPPNGYRAMGERERSMLRRQSELNFPPCPRCSLCVSSASRQKENWIPPSASKKSST